MSVELNVELFNKRVTALTEMMGDNSLIVAYGKEQDNPYLKTITLFNYLFGYELTDTILFLSRDKILIFTSEKKQKILKVLNVEFYDIKSGDFLEKIKALTANNCYSLKDKFQSKIIKSDVYDYFHSLPDLNEQLSVFYSIKDSNAIDYTKTVCKCLTGVLKKSITTAIDSFSTAASIAHSKLSADIEQYINSVDVKDKEWLDWCYSPIIQTNNYNLKPSATSNDDPINKSTNILLISLGLRYHSYCSNVSRTLLLNPTKQLEQLYSFILECQSYLLDKISVGLLFSDLYKIFTEFVDEKYPEYSKSILNHLGFSIGLEFRESLYVINAKNTKTFNDNMLFNFSIGFQNLPNGNAMLLSDTILFHNNSITILTNSHKALENVIFKFTATQTTVFTKSKLRSVKQEDEITNNMKRSLHQKELAQQRHSDGLEKWKNSNSSGDVSEKKKIESYKKESSVPVRRDLKIWIDEANDSVLLPIFGMWVPFHLATIKNVSKSDEGEYCCLRLNFVTPQGGAKKEEMAIVDNTRSVFVRALTFRSSSPQHVADLVKQITDVKKNAEKREKERKDLADLVEQDSLLLIKGRRPIRLNDIYVRPITGKKRMTGSVEIHQNGLRYVHPIGNDVIDILFSNIRHLFFQPCDNELVVLIHVNLKNPIMIGKRKTKDIQFYRETSEAAFDETGRRNRFTGADEDEIEMEHQERLRRTALNKEFNSFAERIRESSPSKLDVDVPFRDLGFTGVPSRSNVLLQPTTDCLVQLTDPPFLVVTLEDLEIAHLERVQFGLRNFDLVFVLKDFSLTPIHINTIPSNQLENVKEWLDSSEVPFTEGPVNLNWNAIMKTINEDPVAFFQEGGWSFLQNDSEEDEEGEESASEFEIEEESEEESEESSEFSEEDDDGSGSGGSGSDGEDESAEDWSDLEKKVVREEEKKRKGREEAEVVKKRRK